MTEIQQRFIQEVMAERAQQDAQWGGPEHDDRHGPFDWFDFLGDQCEQLGTGAIQHGEAYADTPDYRQRFVKIAALCMAAMESHDRRKANKA